MSKSKYINSIKKKKELLIGHSRITFLEREKNRWDDGIFNESSSVGAEYRSTIQKMLIQDDLNEHSLQELFAEYKNDWSDEKKRYFETNDQISYSDFLKAFKDYLPQDIIDSIKKTKSADIQGLTIHESINIFKKYHEIREWIKQEIALEIENQKISDNELLTLANIDQLKIEWCGSARELVGMLDVLQNKKWVHLPASSSRSKATLIHKTFKFQGDQRSLGGITNVYKEYEQITDPFDSIEKKQ